MRRLLPTQAGDEAPRYISSPSTWFEIFRVTFPTRGVDAWILAAVTMTKGIARGSYSGASLSSNNGQSRNLPCSQ